MTLFPHDDSITRAIESWQDYASVMEGEDRACFDSMLDKCYRYARAIEAKAEPFENEALFVALVLEQERAIRRLLATIDRIEKGKRN